MARTFGPPGSYGAEAPAERPVRALIQSIQELTP